MHSSPHHGAVQPSPRSSFVGRLGADGAVPALLLSMIIVPTTFSAKRYGVYATGVRRVNHVPPLSTSQCAPALRSCGRVDSRQQWKMPWTMVGLNPAPLSGDRRGHSTQG